MRKVGLIQKIPPTRESFEETVTVDFVRLTTGGACSNAKDILHWFRKDDRWRLVYQARGDSTI